MSKVLLARFSLLLAGALAWTGCTVKSTERPELSGPSEFSLSFGLTATPDAISQDGGSQSAIVVRAFDANGRPLSGAGFRLDLVTGGLLADYGTLSIRNLSTGADGKATAVYTSPAPLPAGANVPTCESLPGTCVTVVATPTGTNFVTSHTEQVTLRLMPTGVIVAPAQTPTPSFTFNPASPTANVPVQFDGSASCAGAATATGCAANSGSIVAYDWVFSDGGTATGRITSHTFALAQTYSTTLTVTNDRGVKASTTKALSAGAGATPTASFIYSPTPVVAGATVHFDGAASKGGVGHQVVNYLWNFGDGQLGDTGNSRYADHTFASTGVYTVQLTVTDETGLIGSTSQTVTVTAGNPVADFTSTVTNAGTHAMSFDGRLSAASGTATISTYSWNFGDGGSGTGPTPAHTYASTNTYTVTLTITDSTGKTGVVSKNVSVP